MVHTTDQPASPPIVPSQFTGHRFSADIGDTLYTYRILRMDQSLFVYIGTAEQELFTEMAVAMPMVANNSECIATTIIGEQLCSSHELAAQFARRLQKQVYVSCNVPTEREIRPALTRRFVDEVRQCPEHF